MTEYAFELNVLKTFVHHNWPQEVWDEVTTYCSVCDYDVKQDGHKPGCPVVVVSELIAKIQEALEKGDREERVACVKEARTAISRVAFNFGRCEECGLLREEGHEPWCLTGLALDALRRMEAGGVVQGYRESDWIKSMKQAAAKIGARVAMTGPGSIRIEYPSGDRYYFRDGQKHRDSGPAVIMTDGTREYWVEGKLHNPHGPAIDGPARKEHWLNGKRYA